LKFVSSNLILSEDEDTEQVGPDDAESASVDFGAGFPRRVCPMTFAGEFKIMNSSRFLLELLSTILKSASRKIRVGEFRLLRDPAVLRFASSGSGVTRVGESRVPRDSAVLRFASSGSCVMLFGDFKPLRGFRYSRLPIHDPSAKQEAFLHFRSRFHKKIRRTRLG